MFNILIHRKFRIRHRILRTLQDQIVEFYTDHVDIPDSMISLQELARQSRLAEKDIISNIDYLNQQEHIYIEWISDTAYYLISPKGTVAYFDKQYINAGVESTFKKSKEIVVFSLAIATLIVTLYTFASNILMTRQNNDVLKELKIRVDNIERRMDQSR